MLMEDVLKHPTRVLSEQQRRRFFDDGCLVVEGLVDGTWLDRLHAAMEANVESIRNLELNLKDHGFDLVTMPMALQFNKRDIGGAVPNDEMYRMLNYKREPTFEAVATASKVGSHL